jgi:hypothetical protein
MAGSKDTNPVILPPGRAMLATNPKPIGSLAFMKTIGIVLDTRCSAATTGVPSQKTTSVFN